MQDAARIKFWGPLFDDFVDIQFFLILGGHVDDDDTRPVALGQGATRAQEKTRREALGLRRSGGRSPMCPELSLSEDPRASRRVFFLGTCSTLAQGHRACVVVVVVVDGPP